MGHGRRGIVLIGLRRSGKTTVGRRLAQYLGVPFVDLDEHVREQEGRSVGEILLQDGESVFRRMERDAVARIVLGPPRVLAVGGGTPVSPWNRARLGTFGRVLYLQVGERELRARLAGDADPGGRPPIAGTSPDDEVRVLLERRGPLYSSWADKVIDGEGTPEDVAVCCEKVLREI
jgi:shikimate kinase